MKKITLYCLVLLYSCGEDKRGDLPTISPAQETKTLSLNRDGLLESEEINLSLKKFGDVITVILEPTSFNKAHYQYDKQVNNLSAGRHANFPEYCFIDQYKFTKMEQTPELPDNLLNNHLSFIKLNGKSAEESDHLSIEVINQLIYITIDRNALSLTEIAIVNPTVNLKHQLYFDLQSCRKYFGHPNFKKLSNYGGSRNVKEYVTFLYQVI